MVVRMLVSISGAQISRRAAHHARSDRPITFGWIEMARPVKLYVRQRRLPSAFDLVLNQLKQLRFGLSGPVLPLFDRGLECADAIFGRL
jgi:hypothetical protein